MTSNAGADASGSDTSCASAGYKFYQFNPTKVRSGGTFQVSEISFRYQGADVSTSGATGTGNFQSWEPAQNILDGNVNTKACCTVTHLTVEFPSATSVDEFRFATANDVDGRDPVRWTMSGSDDNSNWVTLHSQTSDYACTTSRKTYSDWFAMD